MPCESPSSERPTTWVRPGQVERLRTACYDEAFEPALHQRNEALLTLLYDTGLPVERLCALDVDHVDLDAGDLARPTETDDDAAASASTASAVDATGTRPTVALDPTHSLGTVRLLTSYLYHREADAPALFTTRDGERLSPEAARALVPRVAEVADVRPYTPEERGAPSDVTPRTVRNGTAWRLLRVEDRPAATVRDRLGDPDGSGALDRFDGDASGGDGSSGAAVGRASASQLVDPTLVDRILDTIPEVVYVFDVDGQFRWWNDRFGAATGYSDAEIASMHPLDLVPESDTDQLSAAIDRLADGGTVETAESHLVTKGGTAVPYEFNGAPLADDDGEVWGIVGAGRDVSDRRAALRTAEREQERFELFVDAVTEYAMFLLDPEGHITSWNRGAERIKGYSEAEAVGEHFSMLYPETAVEAGVPGELLRTAAEDGSVEDEGWRVRADGSRFWAHVTITALYEDDELRGFAKVTRDMTDRRAREREIERQRDELERLTQLNAVIRDVDQAIVQAAGREEIEQAVCDRLAAVDSVVGAWVGDVTAVGGRLSPHARAGLADAAVEGRPPADADPSDWPPRRALQTLDVVRFRTTVAAGGADAAGGSSGATRPVTGVAVPLRYRERRYGVLVVYDDETATAIGDREEVVLGELGETIGHAIAASERKEALTSDSVQELTLTVRAPEQFFVRATRHASSVSLEGIAGRSDDAYVEYFTVTDPDADAVQSLDERIEHLTHTRVVSRADGECLCEVGVSEAPIVTAVAEHGGTVTDMTARDGRGVVRVEVPQTADVGRVVDALDAVVEAVDLEAKRTVDRPIRTDHRFRAAVDDRLTSKQKDALEAAYLAGFFEYPRLSTGEDVAESLDIAPSTFHQHIRIGLAKLLGAVVETSS